MDAEASKSQKKLTIMTNEETIIQEKMGRNNPFRVPEGYFDSFTENLMAKLPERQDLRDEAACPELQVVSERPEQQANSTPKNSRLRILRPVLLAAACLCVAIFSVTLYLNQQQETPEQTPVATTANTTVNTIDEEYMDEAADYVMLDNADIYACLSE